MAPKRKAVSESDHLNEAGTKAAAEKRVKSDSAAAAAAASGSGDDGCLTITKPLWKRPDPSVESIDSARRLAQLSKSRHLGYRFQAALRESKRDVALGSEFTNQTMDNSRGWLDGKPNPIKLWAEMKSPDRWDLNQTEHKEMQQIFELLLQSGASRWVNEPDSTDSNKRPIDVATTIPAIVLTAYPPCNLNPRNEYSLLHRLMLLAVIPECLNAMIDRIDRDLLDWADPTTGQTALFVAASTALSYSRRIEVVAYLLEEMVGAVNPYDPCITPAALSQFPSEAADRIRVARSI